MMGSLLPFHSLGRLPLYDRLACEYADTKLLQKQYICCSTARKLALLHRVRCCTEETVDAPIEHPQYHTFIDPITGEPGPAYSTSRNNLPDRPFWAADMPSIVRQSQAMVPKKTSRRQSASPNKAKGKPGSRRRKPGAVDTGGKRATELVQSFEQDEAEDIDEFRDQYVKYELETELIQSESAAQQEDGTKENVNGTSQALVQTKEAKDLTPLPNEELWYNWRKKSVEKEPWNEWWRRPGDSDTAMAAAAAEMGQIKLFGEKPSITEATLYRARKHALKKERLQMEQKRRDEIGPLAYYSEWVKAWRHDTSKEAVQKHFEETGEDVSVQLLNMFQHQTSAEYRRMMGTDVRIQRDPLTMRMRPDQIKKVWGGDPVYPTINYYQDPNQKINYRGPNYREPHTSIWESLRKAGRVMTREKLKRIQEEEAARNVALEAELEEAMAGAVDIGEKEEEEQEQEQEQEDGAKGEREQEQEQEEEERSPIRSKSLINEEQRLEMNEQAEDASVKEHFEGGDVVLGPE